jgi:hypothetical protein
MMTKTANKLKTKQKFGIVVVDEGQPIFQAFGNPFTSMRRVFGFVSKKYLNW